MPLPLFGEVIGGLLRADAATARAFDAIQHLIVARPLRQPAQLPSKILLRRLSTAQPGAAGWWAWSWTTQQHARLDVGRSACDEASGPRFRLLEE